MAHPSNEELVWSWLRRKRHPVRLGQVARYLNTTRTAASHVMRRLVLKGSALRTGNTLRTRYRALAFEPVDLRGTAPGTLENLAKWRETLFAGLSGNERVRR